MMWLSVLSGKVSWLNCEMGGLGEVSGVVSGFSGEVRRLSGAVSGLRSKVSGLNCEIGGVGEVSGVVSEVVK